MPTKKKPVAKKITPAKKATSPSVDYAKAFNQYTDRITKAILLPAISRVITMDQCHDVDDLVGLLKEHFGIDLTWSQIEVALDEIGLTITPRIAIEGPYERDIHNQPTSQHPSGGTKIAIADFYPNPLEEAQMDEGERRFAMGASATPPSGAGVAPAHPQPVHKVEDVQTSTQKPPQGFDLERILSDPGPPGSGGIRFSRSVDGALQKPQTLPSS